MGIVTTMPVDTPTTNALTDLPDDLLDTPPAYLKFGTSAAPMENPPDVGDVMVYMVRARCTAIHGPIERKDGEMRYERSLSIQAVWLPGQKPPAADDEDQPALFDDDGEPTADDDEDDYEPSGMDEFAGGPEFSDEP